MAFFKDTARALRRELGRIVKNPIYPTLMVILPVVAFAFFSEIFSVGVPREFKVAVLDRDNTDLSRTLVSMMDATPSVDIAYGITDMREGEAMVKRGEVIGVVYIPEDFEKDILGNSQTKVAAYVSGLNITANGLVHKDIQTVVTTFAGGIQRQILMKQGLTERQAMANIMPIYFEKHQLFNPYTNYGYYLLPSFLPMMLMVFTLMLATFAIGTELKNRTAAEWMAAADGSIWAAMIGKILPYTTMMFVLSLFMNVVMHKWVGVPMAGSGGVMTLAGLLFILAYQSIGILFVSIFSNMRLALSIGGGYSVLAFSFSGMTFPLVAMDGWVQAVSNIFPFTFYTRIFIDQVMRGAPVYHSYINLGVLALFAIIPLLCLPRLKKIATDQKYWGRT